MLWRPSSGKLSKWKKVTFRVKSAKKWRNSESENNSEQIEAKDKLIESYKTQADMMKKLISRNDLELAKTAVRKFQSFLENSTKFVWLNRKSYELDGEAKQKENDLLLQKVNKLIEINKDLIKNQEAVAAKVAEVEEQNNSAPKVVLEVTFRFWTKFTSF